ncbi:MAG: hypothetical protein RIC55_32835 [Pirellulaceae bacterium]
MDDVDTVDANTVDAETADAETADAAETVDADVVFVGLVAPCKIVDAKAIDESPEQPSTDADEVRPHVVDERTFPFRVLDFCGSAAEWIFGAACMILLLAFLATVPVLQLLSLGYLLEASGRIARSGRLRDGFVDYRKAARVGGVILGTSLMLLPLWFISSLWYDAQLIDPTGLTARNWRIAQLILTVLLVGHVMVAWFCGGRLRHFFWPLTAPLAIASWIVKEVCRVAIKASTKGKTRRTFGERFVADIGRTLPLDRWWFVPAIVIARLRERNLYVAARDSLWEFVVGLRLPHYFWLGLRGFAGAVIWLFVPISLLAVSTSLPPVGGVLLGLLGGLLLSTVLVYLPFLQTNFAAENRFRTLFDVLSVHGFYRRTPFALFFALLVTLAGALPLYLLKIEATPREVAWLPSLVFVAFILPARLLTGWAVGRARHRQPPRWLFFRIISHLFAMPAIPIAMTYALIVFVSQYVSWYGAFSLYEQHAFLVPVPMLGG